MRAGYVVSELTSVSFRTLCRSDVAALQIAHRDARHAGVDVWYADETAEWPVKVYRLTEDYGSSRPEES
jgi:hypothetical protein